MANSVTAFRSHVHVVLCQPRNPLNIGAAARAVANFACGGLRLVNPFDLAFREAVSAVGGAQVLRDASVFATAAEAVADCGLVVGTTAVGHRELQHPLRSIEQPAPRFAMPLSQDRSRSSSARKSSASPMTNSAIATGSRTSLRRLKRRR